MNILNIKELGQSVRIQSVGGICFFNEKWSKKKLSNSKGNDFSTQNINNTKEDYKRNI